MRDAAVRGRAGSRLGGRMAGIALAAATLAAGAPLQAGSGIWTPIGPGGGAVTKVVVDPANPDVLYAATPGAGIFKSTDGAVSWAAASRGLTTDTIVDLAVDPQQPATVYAAAYTGVWKSLDGGATWSPTGLSFVGSGSELLLALAVDPHQPATVYAGTDIQIWVSHDGGSSWARPAGLPFTVEVGQLLADPSSAAVYALTGDNLLLESTDGGEHWRQLRAFPYGGNSDVGSVLAIDPLPPSTLYASFAIATGKQQLQGQTFSSADAGRSWQETGPGGYPVTVGPRHVVYAGSYVSANGGASWQATAVPPDVALGYTAGPPGTVYADTANLGVVVTHDRARHWQPALAGFSASDVTTFAVAGGGGSTLFAGVPLQGVLKSEAPGEPWLPAGGGLPRQGQLAADPTDGAHLYYGWLGAPAPGGLAVTTDGGAVWTEVEPRSGGCLQIESLAVDPAAPRTLYATGGLSAVCGSESLCPVFKSVNAGATWSCLPLGFASQIVVAPSAPAVVYALGAAFGATGPRLSRSADGGASWSAVDGGIPARVLGALGVAVDPTDPERIFFVGSDGSLWTSANGGSRWAVAGHGLPSAANSVTIDPHDPATVYATGFGFGVFRSINGGLNWHPLLGGLPPPAYSGIGPVVVDPARPGLLYVPIGSHGIFSYTQP